MSIVVQLVQIVEDARGIRITPFELRLEAAPNNAIEIV